MRALIAGVFLAGCSIAVCGCGAFEQPENVTISVEAPLPVDQDDEMTILVRVTNTASEVQTLVDLDIADSFLEGVVVRSMDPPFSDAEHIPIDNTQSYSLDLPLPPGQEVVITIHALAAHRGDHSGDFDFCINSAYSCLSYPARTIIR